MLHERVDALTDIQDRQRQNLVVAVMTSVRFHCIEALWNNFRGTECAQLACNEDGIIEKRSASNL